MKSNIAYTIVICMLLILGYIIASVYVMKIARQSCHDTLDDITSEQVINVKNSIYKEKEQMEEAAKIIALKGDLTAESAKEYAASFEKSGMMYSVAFLLPGEKMIYADGIEELNIELDYNIESVKAPYISDVGYMESGMRYCYWAVPVKEGEQIVGIMYRIMNLSSFADEFVVGIYEGEAEIYVVDGNSKTMIVNTVEDSQYYDTEVDIESIGMDLDNKNFSRGRKGYTDLALNENEEKYYAYYKPLGIKNWMVILTLPRRVAFEQANNIRNVMRHLALGEMAVLLSYIISMLRRYKSDTSEKQLQLEQSEYMFKVQQTLFDAHKNPKMVISALQTVAKMLNAETAFLISTEGTIVKELFFWKEDKEGKDNDIVGSNIGKAIPDISSILVRGKSILYYSPDKTVLFDKIDKKTLKKRNVQSVMMASAIDSSSRLVGIIGVVNMSTRWNNTILLECVVRNFMMALTNLKSYRLVKIMGTEDALTGLLNRNSYQQYLKEYSYIEDKEICCIYMDANGLHELNNKYGHKAGDEMLKHIGKYLIEYFGKYNCYRIGGDEFVVLCKEYNKAEIEEKVYLFVKEMMQYNYHISIGLAWKEETSNMETLVGTAEKRMYEDKRMYYISLGEGGKARI